MLAIGIDPGLDGAIVALDAEDGHIVSVQVMPTIVVGKGREYDHKKIHGVLQLGPIFQYPVGIVAIEEGHSFPHRKGKPNPCPVCHRDRNLQAEGSKSAERIGYGRGMLIHACTVLDYKHVTVPPRTWQSILPSRSKPIKDAVARFVLDFFGGEEIPMTPRSHRPHQGACDAAAIALWAARKYRSLGDADGKP